MHFDIAVDFVRRSTFDVQPMLDTLYAVALLVEEFSAAQFAWLAIAPAAKLLELGEVLAADRDARSLPGAEGS